MGLTTNPIVWGLGTFAAVASPMAYVVMNAHSHGPEEREPTLPSNLRILLPYASGAASVVGTLLAASEGSAVLQALRGVQTLPAASGRNLGISVGLLAAVAYVNTLARPGRIPVEIS